MTMSDGRELLEAARSGDLSGVDALLRRGVSPDTFKEHGQTPLALAAMFGHTQVASRLIDAGANPNVGDEAGVTVLMTAAEFPRPEIVRLILAAGAYVNAISSDGRTALLSAIWSADSNTEVIEALVEAGADVSVSDANYGLTPREWADKAGKHTVAELLAEDR
jgi:ankyrin repeat protein